MSEETTGLNIDLPVGFEILKDCQVMTFDEVMEKYSQYLTKAEIEELQKLNNHE